MKIKKRSNRKNIDKYNNERNFTSQQFNPKAIPTKIEANDTQKVNVGLFSTFLLAILAGAFISLGAIFFTFITSQITSSYIFTRLLGGLAFSLGPILIVVAGAELFTSNNLLIIAFASKKVKAVQLLRNLGITYFGNFVGVIITVILFYMTNNWKLDNDEMTVNALNIAISKVNLSISEAFSSGIFSSALICLGVWMASGGKNTFDKVISMLIPVTIYASIGFEHSIANMHFFAFAFLILFASSDLDNPHANISYLAQKNLGDQNNYSTTNLNFIGFVKNLIFVTFGNIIGGSVFVGLVYWFVYLRK